MEDQYWVRREDNETGPFSGQQIQQMVVANMIATSDLLSTDQINWKVLEGFPELVEPPESPADNPGTIPTAQGLSVTAREPDSTPGVERQAASDTSQPAPTTASHPPERRPECSLHEAAARADLEQIKLHLAWGADINLKDKSGRTPLHWAMGYFEFSMPLAEVNQRLSAVEFLLANRADVNATDEYGMTPLHAAAEGLYPEVVKFLITMGANVNAKSKMGVPLHCVQHPEVAKLLLVHGAELKNLDYIDQTPLHHFVEIGRPQVINAVFEELDARTANEENLWDRRDTERIINIEDEAGCTPLDLCAGELWRREIATILKSHGARRSPWWRKRDLWKLVFGCGLVPMLIFGVLTAIDVIPWSKAAPVLIGGALLLFFIHRRGQYPRQRQ